MRLGVIVRDGVTVKVRVNVCDGEIVFVGVFVIVGVSVDVLVG